MSKSVAKCTSGHSQKDIFEIRLDYASTVRDHLGLEQPSEQSGKPVSCVIGDDVKMAILHARRFNSFQLSYNASGPLQDILMSEPDLDSCLEPETCDQLRGSTFTYEPAGIQYTDTRAKPLGFLHLMSCVEDSGTRIAQVL